MILGSNTGLTAIETKRKEIMILGINTGLTAK